MTAHMWHISANDAVVLMIMIMIYGIVTYDSASVKDF